MLGAGAFTENFRSAFNGFNRTDVVQFIQRQTVEYEKSIRLLREENSRLKQAAAEPKMDPELLQAEKEELAQQLAAMTQENEELKAQIDFFTKEKAALTASLREAQAQLASTEQALEEAKAACAEEPEAPTESDSILDRPIAPPAGLSAAPSSFDDLELAAYRRAEQTERLARERAAAASGRMQSIFQQADEKMTLTAADMSILLDSFTTNYEQMKVLMENARSILAESAEGLKSSAELCGIV